MREYDYGDYEGRTTAEIQSERPGWDLFRDGCPNGETPQQVQDRAAAFIALAEGHGGDVLAFAHGHILRAVIVTFIGVEIATASRVGVDTASISALQEHDRYGRRLVLLNWMPRLLAG